MSRTTGKLTISSTNISRLDGTRLMKGAVDNGGFGRATTFLRQDRQLNSGETIWVDGEDDEFLGSSVIVITDAGRPVPLHLAANFAAARKGGGAADVKAPARRSGGGLKGAKKRGAKKSGAKKSGAKKAAAKKSHGGRKAARRSAKKSGK